jgi:hypothetical protein
MQTRIEKAVVEIDNAREAARKTQVEYSKGRATVDDVNKAQGRLIDAHDNHYNVTSGAIPTR